MSRQCKATKRDGNPCTLPSYGASDLCWAHDPKNAEQRRRGQSRGGRNKPSRELVDIKRRLSDLANDVLAGRTEKSTGAVVSQILNVYLRAIATELKVKEVEELEERIEQIEAAVERQQSNRWGRSV